MLAQQIFSASGMHNMLRDAQKDRSHRDESGIYGRDLK
jgi:hypothetical protein